MGAMVLAWGWQLKCASICTHTTVCYTKVLQALSWRMWHIYTQLMYTYWFTIYYVCGHLAIQLSSQVFRQLPSNLGSSQPHPHCFQSWERHLEDTTQAVQGGCHDTCLLSRLRYLSLHWLFGISEYFWTINNTIGLRRSGEVKRWRNPRSYPPLN